MLKKMAFNIGSVSAVLTGVMMLASLSSILLGRELTRTEFGEFGLFRTLILFIAPTVIWGQDIGTARYFSRNSADQYRWDLAFRNVMVIAVILIAISLVVVDFVYHLELYKLIALFFGTFFFCYILLFSNLFRSQQRYNQAILMYSGFRGLFFFFLVAVYFLTKISVQHAIVAYVSVIVLMGFINGMLAYRKIPIGPEKVPSEMHKSGLLLMGVEASISVISYADGLLISKMLGYEQMALYTATVVPVQIFAILTRAGKYVWVPEFGKQERIRFRQLSAVVAAVAFGLLLIFLFGARPILGFLYKGKYDQGAALLRLLAVVGVLRLFYTLSSSVIVGKLETSALKFHLLNTVVSMVIYVAVLYFLVMHYGIIGAGMALIVLTGLRMIGSYLVVYIYRGEKSGVAEQPAA
jgi:O-antigen/teichoic acid export membrane protein